MDFNSYFSVVLDTSTISATPRRTSLYTVDSVSYSSSAVNVEVSFSSDLEGASGTLNANFDPSWFASSNSTVVFEAIGTNAPLITTANSEHS